MYHPVKPHCPFTYVLQQRLSNKCWAYDELWNKVRFQRNAQIVLEPMQYPTWKTIDISGGVTTYRIVLPRRYAQDGHLFAVTSVKLQANTLVLQSEVELQEILTWLAS